MVPVTKIKNEKRVREADVSNPAAPAQAPRVLVTGAAGGLGREIALQLAARGCRLGIADINAAGLAETAAMARARGAEVEEIASDLTLPDAPRGRRRPS